MSLQLVHVDIDVPQDREDLLKIYERGREASLHLPVLLPARGNPVRLLREVADHEALSFYAVRFNDRLIAACVVERSVPDVASIDAVHVRLSSADRDIESRLLARTTAALAPHVDEIRLFLEPEQCSWIEGLHLEGFERDKNWHSEVLYRRIHARPHHS